MTYKDQEVVNWSSVLMHATKKKYTIKNKESSICDEYFF